MTRSDDRIHLRARLLAADAVSEELAPRDAAWLEEHLAGCAECRGAADDFEAIRAELRALPSPEPPRDLWARTAAGLDQVDRSRRRRFAFPALPGFSPSMFGTAMAVAAVVVIVGVSIASQPVETPSGPGPSSGRPGGSQFARTSTEPSGQPVVAIVGDTVVVVDTQSGSILARPADCSGGESCTVTDTGGSKIGSVGGDASGVTGVRIDGDSKQAAVWTNESVKVVPLSTNPVKPAVSPSPLPTATPISTATAAPAQSGGPVETPTPPAESPSPSQSVAVSPSPSVSPSTTPGPSAVTQPVTILNGYVMVGEAQFSPDGGWLAFAAKPVQAAGTMPVGPDVFVWHAGDIAARPLTTSHAATFSGWAGGSIILSQVLPSAIVPDFHPAATATATATAAPTGSPSAETGGPSSSESPSASPPEATPTPSETPSVSAPPQSASPSAPAPSYVAVSYLVDPATCAAERLEPSIFRPVVDPSRTRVAYWLGTVDLDPTGTPRLVQGDVYYNLWANIRRMPATVCASSPQTAPTASPSSSVSAVPEPQASGSATAESTNVPSAPASASASAKHQAQSPKVSAAPTLPALPALPQRIPLTTSGGLTGDWTARWDPLGLHLGVWLADPARPRQGQLTVFAIDPVTSRLAVAGPLLAAPAAGAFQLTTGAVVFASPADMGDGKTHVWQWPAEPPKVIALPSSTPGKPDTSERPGS